MDHLGLNLGDEFRPKNFINLFKKDEHDFHTFPKTIGWEWDEKRGFYATGERDVVLINQFLQSWLFFGLMHTVLQDENWVDTDFLVPNVSTLIDTNRLPDYLNSWETREYNDKAGQTLRMIRAQVALDKAREVVLMYCSSDAKNKKALQESPNKVDEKLALSLMVLGETLTNCKCRIVERVGFSIRGWHGDANEGWGTPLCVIEKMEEMGWCKRTTYMLKGQLRSHATSLLSVYKSHAETTFRGHKNCEQDGCIVKSIEDDGKTYKTRHQPDCTDQKCSLIGPDMDRILEEIRGGHIPLLEYKKANDDGEMMVDVIRHTPYQNYATISHVWADGYGNPLKNKLWKCQLDFFKTLFEGVDKKDPRNTLFWIDTLAIPVDPKMKVARKSAIQKIHEIYTKANYTIVIDNGLSEMTSGSTYEGTAMKILASGWMRRLWTLQEAYLSRRLFFAFADKELRDLDDLEKLYPQANHLLTSNIPTAARNYFHNLLGPDRRARISEVPTTTGFSLLASVWRAAQWRTTSHPEHETLALATLLNVDYQNTKIDEAGILPEATTMQITDSTRHKESSKSDTELEKMMEDLWTLIDETCPGSIPPGIIFLPGGRLSIPGFGWAPRTWMSGQEVDYPDPLSHMASAARLVPGKGLLVQYPGFLLHAKSANSILWPEQKPIHFPSDSTLLEWYEVEAEKDTPMSKISQGTSAERAERLAIILCRPKPREIPEIALLVKIEREIVQREFDGQRQSKIYLVHTMCRVWIKREASFDRLSNWKGFINQSELQAEKFICGEVLDATQKWYVDGQPNLSETLAPVTRTSTMTSTAGAASTTSRGQRGRGMSGIGGAYPRRSIAPQIMQNTRPMPSQRGNPRGLPTRQTTSVAGSITNNSTAARTIPGRAVQNSSQRGGIRRAETFPNNRL